MMRLTLITASLAVLAALGGAGPQDAAAQGASCLTATPPAVERPAHRIRFGITPQLAGTVGEGQGTVVPESAVKRDAALAKLKPKHREVVIRLNRLFESDGDKGIERFARRARHYGRLGFAVESQVRYHPSPAQEGDMRAWRRFVRRASRALGRVPATVSLTITNEVNLPISANTSDGAYERAIDAIVKGVPAARRALDQVGRGDVELGFSYAYRFLPDRDAEFWSSIGDASTPAFRRALDYVGVQLYPGLFYPPALTTQTAGEATLEGLTLVRDCYMPMAGLGAGTGDLDQRERVCDQPRPRRAAPGGRARGHGAAAPSLQRPARDQRLPLLQPARQQARRDRPLRRRRPAALRLFAASPHSANIAG